MTRSLLALSENKLRKLIVLEDNKSYLEYLKPLEKVDPRITVMPFNGYSWDTYTMLEEQGLLDDVPKIPWGDGVHPNLQFISHIPMTVAGEQLVNQFLRCIPDNSWLFRFGRVPMNLVLGEWVWQRLSAGHLDAVRCKLSVIAESTAHISLSLPAPQLLPYDNHFHPTVPRNIHFTTMYKSEVRKLGHPMLAINIVPHEKPIIDGNMLEKWDYCLRRLFVLKTKPLRVAIGSLAPGSGTLIKSLTDLNLPPEQRVDARKEVRRLTIEEWALVVKAFDEWPFAPSDLMIHDSYNPQNKSNNRFFR